MCRVRNASDSQRFVRPSAHVTTHSRKAPLADERLLAHMTVTHAELRCGSGVNNAAQPLECNVGLVIHRIRDRWSLSDSADNRRPSAQWT
jgi:hypothetical protein